MRLTATLLFLTAVVCGSALADRKTSPPPPPGIIDAGAGIPTPAPLFDLRGARVFNWVSDGGWEGFDFELNPTFLRPPVFLFIQNHHGVPTPDRRQATVIADWTFICGDPRLSYGSAGYDSWRRDIGIRISNEKVIVRTMVTFYELVLMTDPYDPDAESSIGHGRLIAGPFIGVGKANAAISWQAFLNAFGWARGLNLDFGQDETGDNQLQFKALAESFKHLKPIVPLTPPPY
jgi:hypothetical protein